MNVHILAQLMIEDDQGNHIDAAKIRSRKARELLLYFIIFHRRKIPVELLCETFWPGVEERYARASLQTAISSIRRCLGKSVLTYSDGSYCFDKDNEIIVDAEELENSIMKARSCDSKEERVQILKQVVEDYKDDVLPEYRYEEWIVQAREHYKDLLIDVLLELTEYAEQTKNAAEAHALSKRVLEKDPLNEQACLSYMKALAQLGQETEVLRFYESFSRRIEKELGVLPCQQLKDLHDQILTCRKKVTWIVIIKAKPIDEVIQILKNHLRDNDEIKILSGEKMALFVQDVDRNTAETIQKRIEECLNQHSIRATVSSRLAR